MLRTNVKLNKTRDQVTLSSLPNRSTYGALYSNLSDPIYT